MSDDLIYYNLHLNNTKDVAIPAEIVDQRTMNILATPKDYEMSIVRFQISAALIPIFKPKSINPLLPNQTDMSVSLSYGGTTIQEYVSVSDLEMKSGVYSYNVFLDHVNEAMATAFIALNAAVGGITATNPPSFYLDCHTSLISMYVQTDYLKSNINHVSIFCNQPLMNKLNLPYNQYLGAGAPLGTDYEIEVKSYIELIPPVGQRFGKPFNVVNVPGDVLQLCQEFPSLNTWSGVKSLLFTSSLIPITKEFVTLAVDQNQNYNVSGSSKPILTDFDLNQDTGDGSNIRGIIQYIPGAEYRMKTLLGNSPFTAIDITVLWQDFLGNVYPVYLAKDTSLSIKVMFRKKTRGK